MRYAEQDAGMYVKENVVVEERVGALGLLAAVAGALLAAAVAVALDGALPTPLTRADLATGRFIAELAHEHLVNLTTMGPRVAGSYELEVGGVGAAVGAVRGVAAHAAPHHRVQWEVWREGEHVGAFPLSFLDGMNHVYRDVSSVVALLRPQRPQRPQRPTRPALLLNCHIDTVPDSPGASDDAAGCAVLLETLRALAASVEPLTRDVVLLMNGAEENVLQASHAFVTRHRWAKRARVFLNVEACGAGGREVLFQAGPHDAWLLEAYARHAPHPFASSLAHELFASGLVPADTDFRIFRDHGALSGLDLAWSARGHVYHTRLDTAARVTPAVLQRTGDNVLAVARALLADPRLDEPPDTVTALPVYFDVLGVAMVRLGAGAALLVAAAAVLTVLGATRAAGRGVPSGAWWALCGRNALVALASGAGGALAAGALGLALHAAGARLRWYAWPPLAVALFAPASLAAMGALSAKLGGRVPGDGRGGLSMRAMGAGCALLAAALATGSAACGLRSGFVPLMWAAAGAGGLGLAPGGGGRRWAARWAAWAVLPMLQTCYLSLGFLLMFVPVAGRAGPSFGPFPPDMAMGVMVGSLTAWCCSWSLPLWSTSSHRGRRTALRALSAWAAVAVLVALWLEPYTSEAPQRLMVFHTRRTQHNTTPPHVEHFYWVPELDVNTADTFHRYFPSGRSVTREECTRLVYCGLPYYLPVLELLPRSVMAPAPALPASTVAAVTVEVLEGEGEGGLAVRVRGEGGPAHAVLIARVAGEGRVVRLEGPPGAGVEVTPLPAAPGTYFVSVFSGRARPWSVTLHVRWPRGALVPRVGERGQLSVAGHALFGPHKTSPSLKAKLDTLPAWVAATAWTVDQHLYTL